MRSAILSLIVAGQLLHAGHGFAPPILSRSHNGRATSLEASSVRHQPFLTTTNNGAAAKSPMPAWVKDCRTAVAGLAVGCLLVVSPAATLATGTAVTIDATSTMHVAAGFGSSYETLDFSLPSYGDSQSSSSPPKKDVPSFNPFGDFEPSIKTQSPATAPASTKIAETATTTITTPEPIAATDFKLPEMKMPDMPALKMPEMKMPEMKMPDMAAMKMPDMSSSSAKMPDMPAMKMPDVKMPEMKMPDFKMPELTAPKLPSSFKMPEISLPKLPESVSGGGTAASPKMTIPEVSMPDMPKFSVPAVSMPELNLPKINLPSLPNPFGGGGGGGAAQVDYAATPQTVRDEAAKAARLVYLDADQLAKDAEAKAREIRQAAEVQKKAADVAKDTACATRPGGKWICLRNPFNVGY